MWCECGWQQFGETTRELALAQYAQHVVDQVDAALARQPQPDGTPDYVALLQEAKKRVAASVLYRRFIDGTPLENDIAVWMADFASEQLEALARQGDAPQVNLEKLQADQWSHAEAKRLERIANDLIETIPLTGEAGIRMAMFGHVREALFKARQGDAHE